MRDALFGSLPLVGVSGYVVMMAIVALVAVALLVTAHVRRRYAAMIKDVRRNGGQVPPAFHSGTLDQIAREVQAAAEQHGGDINTQAIIEHNIQSDLAGLLAGERFVKAATGLTIILGLLGTVTGLTLSIGKLAALVSGSAPAGGDITESLTRGLTQALSGMSLAFATSLFGIAAAIVMTLAGVFFNVPDRRTAFMVQLEDYLDNVLLAAHRPAGAGRAITAGAPGAALEPLVARFGQSVAALETTVGQFGEALRTFSATTRDFREFNLHLKDNVQRMSLAFGDLSETLKREVGALGTRGRT
jgi:biopolymer transport protein ExbB/TolQ